MIDYSFHDEKLPPGQIPIETSNITDFRGFINLISDSKRTSPTMGAVTGYAGVGKTVAIQAYLNQMLPRSHTLLPAAIKVTVKPNSTPKALATDIVKALEDKARGNTIFEVADEAAAAIARNDLELLFIDEADRLKDASFDVVRHLFDRTGCPIVVVGLPQIVRVIDAQDKFESRVGLRMAFAQLDLDEVINLLLPQLVIAGWKFNPDSDREMGRKIWEMVRPSLRKLRNLLERASYLSQRDGNNRIILRHIENSFEWTASANDKKRLEKANQMNEMDMDNPTLEQESELRNKDKQQKNRRSDGCQSV